MENKKVDIMALDKATLEFAIKIAWQYEFTSKNTKAGNIRAQALRDVQQTLTYYLEKVSEKTMSNEQIATEKIQADLAWKLCWLAFVRTCNAEEPGSCEKCDFQAICSNPDSQESIAAQAKFLNAAAGILSGGLCKKTGDEEVSNPEDTMPQLRFHDAGAVADAIIAELARSTSKLTGDILLVENMEESDEKITVSAEKCEYEVFGTKGCYAIYVTDHLSTWLPKIKKQVKADPMGPVLVTDGCGRDELAALLRKIQDTCRG